MGKHAGLHSLPTIVWTMGGTGQVAHDRVPKSAVAFSLTNPKARGGEEVKKSSSA